MLHDNFLKARSRGKVFSCFVDFRKAFDSIWHKGLFLKLLQSNVGDNVYDLIIDMYNKSHCAVKIGQNTSTKSFPYNRGVRQGCVLSPLVFNLFTNELPVLLENDKVDPLILPNGEKISSLLYADDLIILSQSASGLQNCLNLLSEFCVKWNLTANLKKTKAMVFQKKNKRINKFYFIHNDHGNPIHISWNNNICLW